MNHPLKREFQFFLDHQVDLVRQHNGKVVVIVGDKVDGVFSDELEALTEAQKTHPLGSFLIQAVRPGTDAYSRTHHSRVSFR